MLSNNKITYFEFEIEGIQIDSLDELIPDIIDNYDNNIVKSGIGMLSGLDAGMNQLCRIYIPKHPLSMQIDLYDNGPDGPAGTEGIIYTDVLLEFLYSDDNDGNIFNGTPNDIDIITKINFTFIDDSKLTAIIFNSGKEKWINFIRDDAALAEGKTFYVDNLNDWSYKLSSTKYNVTETKLKDLLVEE